MSNITFPPGPSLFAPLQPSSDRIGVTVCTTVGIAPRVGTDEKSKGGHWTRVRGVPIESVPQTIQRPRILPTEAEVETGAHGPPWVNGTEADAIAWLASADDAIDLRGYEGRPHGPIHQLGIVMQRSKNVPSSPGSIHARVALFGFYQRRQVGAAIDPARWAPVGVSRLLRENVPYTFDLTDVLWNALPTALALVAFLPNYERDTWQGCLEFFACCPVRLK